MLTFFIALFSVILVLVCLFVVLLVLMQKPSSNAGMGAALGGGAAEQAFGGEATNVLTRGTIYAIIAFFVISFGLYLGALYASGDRERAGEGEASLLKLEETLDPEAVDAEPAPGAEEEIIEIETPSVDGSESMQSAEPLDLSDLDDGNDR